MENIQNTDCAQYLLSHSREPQSLILILNFIINKEKMRGGEVPQTCKDHSKGIREMAQ